MAKFVSVIFIVFVVLVLFVAAGDLFPEGSALRDMADGMRAVAGDMFGGGYGAVTPG